MTFHWFSKHLDLFQAVFRKNGGHREGAGDLVRKHIEISFDALNLCVKRLFADCYLMFPLSPVVFKLFLKTSNLGIVRPNVVIDGANKASVEVCWRP